MKRWAIFSLIFILLISSISAITISPAKYSFDFEPNFETEVSFKVDSQLDRELEFYIIGDLAEYMELSKKSVFKKGSFSVKIRLPPSLDSPGKKMTLVGARELLDKELAAGIGTAVAIQAPIYIFIPYPGKYVESSFRAHDVNLNEPIKFELDIQSRGKEPVSINPRIEIFSEAGRLLETFEFKERDLQENDKIELIKTLSTAGYVAGKYVAHSIIDYNGKVSRQNVSFRIGELNMEIINYTKEIVLGDIKPFTMDIESSWNDVIDGAYAKVRIGNATTYVASFTTTPTSLEPWEKKTIFGFFNTSNIQNGTYNVFMDVYYFGNNLEKNTKKTGQVAFVFPKEEEVVNYYLISSIFLGIILFILIFFWIITKLFKVSVKNAKKRK